MARHAGFAVAASVGEAYLNQTLWAAFGDLEPISSSQLFALPSTVPLGGGSTVRLSGVALFEQRPTLHLRANPGNTVSMTAAAVLYVAANIDPSVPVDLGQTWRLRIVGSVDVAVDVDVAAAGLYLRWTPSGSSISDLNVTLLEGPGIPGWLVDALNSPEVHAAMTTALRAVGPVRISSKLFDSHIRRTQPGSFRETGFSVFEWFTIAADVTHVALRVKDGSISIGVDLAGLSNGTEDLLIDLFGEVGDGAVYRWPVFDNTTSTERPLLVGSSLTTGAGDIAVLFNAAVLGALVDRISSQISGTPIAEKVKINSISLRPDHFEKPLRGREIGLRFDFNVHHQDAGDVSGRAFLQPFLVYDAENHPNPSFPSTWRIYIGLVEIDVPWWVDVAVVLAGIALAELFPALTPLLAVGVIGSLDGVIPGIVSSVESTSQNALGRGAFLANASSDTTLPTAKHQPAYSNVDRVAVTTEGIELHMGTVAPSVRFPKDDATLDVASLSFSMDGGSPAPYRISLTLRDDLASLGGDCTARLLVRRADTGVEVAEQAGPYNTSRAVVFDHLNPQLYFVDSYLVEAQIWLNRESMTGLLFAVDAPVPVTDPLDRHHPFLTWAPHWAHFANPGTGGAWWHRLSRPTLHRTAVSARCLTLRQRAARLGSDRFGLNVTYSDNLGFPWVDLPANRHAVCDYCFFGGPTRTQPLPQEDWFS